MESKIPVGPRGEVEIKIGGRKREIRIGCRAIYLIQRQLPDVVVGRDNPMALGWPGYAAVLYGGLVQAGASVTFEQACDWMDEATREPSRLDEIVAALSAAMSAFFEPMVKDAEKHSAKNV
jgi:hypothetical protein